MIFNADNTLRYSTYIGANSNSVYRGVTDQAVAPNGDLYVCYSTLNVTAIGEFTGFPTLPSTALQATYTNQGLILRFSKTGTLLGGTYLPNDAIAPAAFDLPMGIALRPNGNVVVMTKQGQVRELDAALTTSIKNFNPFGTAIPASTAEKNLITDIALDDAGRIHFVANVGSASPKPTTTGALQAQSNMTVNIYSGYYGIVDCDGKSIVYGTEIGSGGATGPVTTTQFYDIAVEGCNAYFAGRSSGAKNFPVTASAYNNAGTRLLKGYDISTSSIVTVGTSNKGSAIAPSKAVVSIS